ncbi:hypothetical protein HPB47_015674 [Ixodes persulcatus]|uniref:Uncharacterized protein n=1 Tax=Ixodes persulcatus TaxID=34615 RepID=A0AC60QVG4_IXOPE|nr:hypothetical protein HPB47_015674 [Ixodes persulcatus]
MPAKKDRTCFVPLCKGGYKSAVEKVSLFRAPVDPLRRQEWARNIKREDKVLDETCVVCSRHFDERYIEKTFKHVINGELVELDRERPVLTDDAVPTIFPDAPSYLTRPVPKKRKERNLTDRGTPPLKRRAASGFTHDCDPGNAYTEPARETHPFSDILPPSIKSSRGMEYDMQWVLECISMRMKSPQLYEYVRRHKILALPSKSCLDKHMQGFKSTFGFNASVFSALEKKTRDMDDFSRHGGLVYDEIKLSENINVTASGELSGFVDLGPFMKDSNKTALSDHGLVVVFQPYKGKWTQILRVFASRGNVKAPVLPKILLEATILAEKSGLFVDFWTSDGAPWNRCLWKLLGIKALSKEITCKVPHPVDSARSLHFISEFPHLIKCVRNTFVSKGVQIPLQWQRLITREFDHGGLLYPSKPLEALVTRLENAFTVFFTRNKLHAKSMICFLRFLQGHALQEVGCSEHERLTVSIFRSALRVPNCACAACFAGMESGSPKTRFSRPFFFSVKPGSDSCV